MPTILVTGATGFIGHYVVSSLLQNGCKVVASSSSQDKARSYPWFSKVTYRVLDLSLQDDKTDYYLYFNAPDAAIHLAWEGLPNYMAEFHMKENLPRHYAFLHNLVKNGLKDLTVTGTCFEYGMREGVLKEDMPANPSNAYARAKDELRMALAALQQDIRFHFKWARLFYMYGNGQNPKSLFSQLQSAIDNHAAVFNMSGGEQLRDYLPVEKVADYIVQIALQNRVEGIINCCSGRPVSVKKMVADYLAARGASIQLNLGYYPYTDYEPRAFWGDTSLLNSVLK